MKMTYTVGQRQTEGLESEQESRRSFTMINFNSNKTKKKISAVIIILLVIAMVVPCLLYFL